MKAIIGVLLLAQLGAFAADGLSSARREMEKDDIADGVAQRLQRGDPQQRLAALVNAETDPAFRDFIRQKLTAAGPIHPAIGVFVGPPWKGKTPAQVVEILRKQFAAQPSPAPEGSAYSRAVVPASPAPSTSGPDAVARKLSEAKALVLYPAAADPASPLTARIKEVVARLKAGNDPILISSSAPLVVTQMAAGELGIAPAH